MKNLKITKNEIYFSPKVLERARQMIQEQGMDPADLPDGIAEFSETILGITFHGSAKVWIRFIYQ